MNARTCGTVGTAICLLLSSTLPGSAASQLVGAQPKIAKVFFAQHHVLTPDSPYFKLVGNLEALIKVQAYAPAPRTSPAVVAARLKLRSDTLELPLKGPRQLPRPPAGDPLLVEQTYDGGFTAIIPREWVAPGLDVTIELKEGSTKVLDSVVYHKLNIGAPTRLIMTMFDFHFFGGDKGADYPEGWFEGLGARLPVAELELRRVRHIVFDSLVMQPRGVPATRCGSREEYTKKTGLGFDGEQAQAGMWNGALREAAGAGWGGTRRVYYSNIYGVPCGGTGGGLSGEGNGRQHGILLHELGHAFGLPDLVKAGNYPYIGPMHGIDAPGKIPTAFHVGPTWGFDPLQHEFLSPRTEDGCYTRDPMGGGGANKDGGPGLYRFFSDYHFSRIRDCLEKTQVTWDERTGRYFQWDQESGSYSILAREQGRPNCPVEDNIDVISVLASASLVTPEANIVYPPIGPYQAGRLESFDASSVAGRSRARNDGYNESACFCLRVTQGKKVTTYLVKKGLSPQDDPKKPESFAVFAMNLPARDGVITQVDLLHTPEVMSKGVKSDCRVLYGWKTSSSTAHGTELVTALYPAHKESAGADTRTASRATLKKVSALPPPLPAVRQARKLAVDRQAALDRALEQTLVKLSDAQALNPVTLRLSLSAAPIVLVAAEAGGSLTFRAAGADREAKIAWDTLPPADRLTLAILTAKLKPESTDAQAMAGVYLEINGNVSQAEGYYQKAGPESRAKLEALFE